MQLFANNAASTLAAPIGASDTTLQLAPNDGDKFPNPQAGDFFLITLYKRLGATELNHDIARCTGRNGDVLTIERNIEGKTPGSFSKDDFVELRLTAGAILPVENGALTGALNEAKTKPLAVATALPIGAGGANSYTITGNGTLNQFDSIAAGAVRRTEFTGTVTLTHNANVNTLLTSANITTQQGDWAEWISLGAGKWKMISYTRANGSSLTQQSLVAGANISIATNGNSATISANAGNYATSLKFS